MDSFLEKMLNQEFDRLKFTRRPDPDGPADWTTGIHMESDATFRARIKAELAKESGE